MRQGIEALAMAMKRLMIEAIGVRGSLDEEGETHISILCNCGYEGSRSE